jgi:hypothetical protein
LKFNLSGDRFSDEQSLKNGGLSNILEKIYIAFINKSAPQEYLRLIIRVMLKLRLVSKKTWEEIDFPLWIRSPCLAYVSGSECMRKKFDTCLMQDKG